jgi:hypothetical protein
MTEHYTNRLADRMAKYNIDQTQVKALVERYNNGKVYIRIAQLDKVEHSNGSHGNCVTLVIIDGRPITVMLSHSYQRWHDGKLHFHYA